VRSAWRRLAAALDPVPPAPVHADPHGANYVVVGDRPYLVDWDQVDLRARIRWWAAFKALRNGFWVDDRGDRAMAEAAARGFLEVMATMA